MSLMSRADREQLGRRFASELSAGVQVGLRVHEEECPACSQAEEILREVTSLEPRLQLSVDRGGAGERPEIRVEGAARGEVRFVGFPSGYEFPAFIDSIVEVSSGRTTLSAEALKRLGAIHRPVHLRVFTTPT